MQANPQSGPSIHGHSRLLILVPTLCLGAMLVAVAAPLLHGLSVPARMLCLLFLAIPVPYVVFHAILILTIASIYLSFLVAYIICTIQVPVSHS